MSIREGIALGVNEVFNSFTPKEVQSLVMSGWKALEEDYLNQ